MGENLKVNFSDDEIASEVREYKAVPTGYYHCAITNVEDATVQSNDKGNFGKPMWKLTLVVQDGEYSKQHFFPQVMLWDGMLKSVSQILKSVGMGDLLKKNTIPKGEALLGKTLDAYVIKKRDSYNEKALRESGDNSPLFKNEVKGYRAHEAETGAGGSSSLLPG